MLAQFLYTGQYTKEVATHKIKPGNFCLILVIGLFQWLYQQHPFPFTDVNVEHMQTMLALLYTLSTSSKRRVFVCLAKTLIAALQIPNTQLVTMVPLPTTRLFLLLEYMLEYTSSPPDQLLLHVSQNLYNWSAVS